MGTASLDFNAIANGQEQPQGQPQPQPSGQPGSLDFNAITAQPQQSQPNDQNDWMQRAADAVESGVTNLGVGVAKGAMQTVNTVSKGIHAIPYVGEYLAPQEGITAADNIATAHGAMQKVGVGAEAIAETLLGDEALKAASLGDKLLKISKVAETYENASPFVKQAIEHGLQAARAGALTGGETLAKTGDVGEAAKAAVVGAAAGGALSVAGKVLPKVWASATGKAIQSDLQDGIRGVVSDVADSTGIEAPESATINRSVEGLADGVQTKAKGLFQAIDDATDGEFTNIQGKIKNVDDKLREIAGTDDTLEEKLYSQKTALAVKLDEAIEQAAKNGVDPETADAARSAWKQMSALRDVDTQIKASTDVFKGEEYVDPRRLAPRLKKLDDTGRLSDGLGEDSASELLQHARDARDQLISRGKKIATAKVAGSVAGIGGIGGAAAHVLSGQK